MSAYVSLMYIVFKTQHVNAITTLALVMAQKKENPYVGLHMKNLSYFYHYTENEIHTTLVKLNANIRSKIVHTAHPQRNIPS